jgi:hypothetical protein
MPSRFREGKGRRVGWIVEEGTYPTQRFGEGLKSRRSQQGTRRTTKCHNHHVQFFLIPTGLIAAFVKAACSF